MNTRTVGLALAVVLLLGGCTAPPAGGTPGDSWSDVRVHVVDDHPDPTVVTVGAAPPGHAGLAVEFANGTVREFPDARGIEDLPDAVVPRTVSLRPIGEGVETRTYRWSGTQSATAVFEDVPRNASVFYSVAAPDGDEPLRTLGRLGCGPEAVFTDATVRVDASGAIAVSSDCRVD
ncbi:hypothetical protein [Halobacterium hubeiense]|uniref:hypothetical protein n=1 Tax=Halobacterium hubeiense TaxID=1407499 RepID=UPI003C76BD0C